jgi:two-component system, OmpR family, response regulator
MEANKSITKMVKSKIFIVEDDLNFGSVMVAYLEMNGYEVVWVNDGKLAIATFNKSFFDLCILDVMLPHVDGFTIGTEIKKQKPATPIIFLTAKTLKDDVLKGFKIGADDYITKPFDSDVLICKIKAILNRNQFTPSVSGGSDELEIGSYKFDHKKRLLTGPQNTETKLSPKESELLKQLIISKNHVLDRDYTLEKIWGEKGYFTARSMDVYITKLRKYLKDDPKLEIANIHGSGYILKES